MCSSQVGRSSEDVGQTRREAEREREGGGGGGEDGRNNQGSSIIRGRRREKGTDGDQRWALGWGGVGW